MKLKALYEDSYCLVVNKPHNVLIHKSYYARNIKETTLLEQLEEKYARAFYPVHRLDRKTSGVLLLCKDKTQVAAFQAAIQESTTKKRYVAIVRGFLNEKTTVDSPVKNPDTGVYKEASTLCEPMNTIELPIPVHPYKTARYSLISLAPQTGRMHQLRIHMNKISHPIIGDYKYGDRFHNRMFEAEFGIDTMLLHARSLEFEHPLSKEKLQLKAGYSGNWLILLKKFKWKNF